MRKFIFSTQLLGAVWGGWSTVQATRKGPRDWRLALMWVSWAATVAIAVGTVIKDANEADVEIED